MSHYLSKRCADPSYFFSTVSHTMSPKDDSFRDGFAKRVYLHNTKEGSEIFKVFVFFIKSL